MNTLIYKKETDNDDDFIEFLKEGVNADIIITQTKEEVVKGFLEFDNISRVIIMNMALRSDVGVIKYIKDYHPETKIIAYSTSATKEVVDIIKDVDLIIMDNSIENLKKIKRFIN
jgi:xanthine dehydrogenase iron-sulfur cluster and FAD-binding subunit A